MGKLVCYKEEGYDLVYSSNIYFIIYSHIQTKIKWLKLEVGQNILEVA